MQFHRRCADFTAPKQETQLHLNSSHGAKARIRRWLIAITTCVAIALPVASFSEAHAATQSSTGSSITTIKVMASDQVAKTVAPRVIPDTGGWGYVSDGNLRSNPNLNAQIIDTIHNQWVNILCWIDGGPNGFGSSRWFKAQYYSLQGYLSSGVVSSQPTVGHC